MDPKVGGERLEAHSPWEFIVAIHLETGNNCDRGQIVDLSSTGVSSTQRGSSESFPVTWLPTGL